MGVRGEKGLKTARTVVAWVYMRLLSSFIISCIERLQRIRGELDASDNAKSEGVGCDG